MGADEAFTAHVCSDLSASICRQMEAGQRSRQAERSWSDGGEKTCVRSTVTLFDSAENKETKQPRTQTRAVKQGNAALCASRSHLSLTRSSQISAFVLLLTSLTAKTKINVTFLQSIVPRRALHAVAETVTCSWLTWARALFEAGSVDFSPH